MALSVGDRLGPYEILSKLGEGGMGAVWKARDTRLDRIVAIKVSKEEFSERFEREARAVAALNHPHICHLYDVGPNYLVMEYVDGAPLISAAKPGPLTLEKALEYSGQILDALEAAHRKGIVHRDLKPANILVNKQGVKLLDFGLSKPIAPLRDSDSTVTAGLTAQGQIIGTLHYMSPEQLQGAETDARTDIFSFGCVLYQMLSGHQAFEGGNTATVIAAVLEHEPPPLDVSPVLARILKTCLAKDADQRFQSALDLKRALAWALEQPSDVKTPEAADHSNRRMMFATMGTVGLLFAFGAGWALSHFRQPAPAEERVLRVEINPPENGRFTIGAAAGGFALSPFGKTIAYVASANGTTGLWVRPLDGTSARFLSGTEGAYAPFWSPDGKSIAFFAPGKLRRIDLDGGEPTTICEVTAGRGGAWTEDGRIIYASLTSPLRVVPDSGGTPKALTMGAVHYWPQVLPGGHFLYHAQTGGSDGDGIYAASLAKPAERIKLLATETNAIFAPGEDGKDYLLWLQGTALVAQEFDPLTLKLSGEPRPIADPVGKSAITGRINVSASSNGLLLYDASDSVNQLSWIDSNGKPAGVVGGPTEYVTFRISPDGRTIAAATGNPPRADLWLIDVLRGVSSRFTYTKNGKLDPVWSPNGRTLVYRTAAPPGLYRKDAGGAGGEERIATQGFATPTDWSRDGKLLLFHQGSPRGTDLWTIPMNADGKPGGDAKPYLQSQFAESEGQFSPEASPRWVAYQSNETGRLEVYVQSFPMPGGKVQVSTEGGRFPKWGPGGRELYYVSPDDKLMAVSLKLTSSTVEPSAPRELFPLPTGTINFIPYDVASDGRFLVQAPAEKQSTLSMVINWPMMAKQSQR